VNRYLATVRNLLRTARDEWQWIEYSEDPFVVRRNERDRWLTQEQQIA
jgi:hypothetical protein